MNDVVEQIVSSLAAVHLSEPPDVDQRTAAYWWGRHDEDIAWGLAMCHTAAKEPIACALYLASVAEDLSDARAIKIWAYNLAEEVATTRHRHRLAVESYSPKWGHQAARDGVILGIWPHLREYVPGYAGRAKHYGCHWRAYLAIRDGVQCRVQDVVSGFRRDLSNLSRGLISNDFKERHRAGAVRRLANAAEYTRHLRIMDVESPGTASDGAHVGRR